MKILILLVLLASNLYAIDHEADIWYFGRWAGLDFRRGIPEIAEPGMIDTQEGCSSISDKDGNLLFYTDGTTIWHNYNHFIIPFGFELMGSFSTAQSSIIIPRPGSDSIFYVLTLDMAAKENGLRYTIVDMSIPNGYDFGEVTEKNILLNTPMTEHLTAVHHANRKDIWVLAHEWNSDAFHAYLVTEDGITLNPVTSNCGFNYSIDKSLAVGCMKVSPNGRKIALTLSNSTQLIEIFDFDDNTGQVSNPISLPYGIGKDLGFYGVEFSQDCSKLFVSCIRVDPPEIIQFDLSSNNIEIIKNSKTTIGIQSESKPPYYPSGALQLARNGKIYAASGGNKFLGVINNPNEKGIDCNYVDSAVVLHEVAYCMLGLPNFIQSYFLPQCDGNGFEYIDFLYTDGLEVNGDAEKQDSIIRLTGTEANNASAIWYNQLVPVNKAFETEFRFRFSEPHNAFNDGSNPGADGIVFLISTENDFKTGKSGGGLGYNGLNNCIAIEFDTYRNQAQPLNDPDGNHAAIFYIDESGESLGHGSEHELAMNSDIIELLADSSIYYAKIDYDIEPGALRVFIDKSGDFKDHTMVLEIEDFDITKYLDLEDNMNAYVAITSATGTSYENHDLLYWSYCPEYKPEPTKVKEEFVSEEPKTFSLYPTPCQNQVYIDLQSFNFQNASISIYNLLGEEVRAMENVNPGLIGVDMQGLTGGVYNVVVRSGEEVFVGKVLKK